MTEKALALPRLIRGHIAASLLLIADCKLHSARCHPNCRGKGSYGQELTPAPSAA